MDIGAEQRRQWTSVGAALALLAAIAAQQWAVPTAAEADPYHSAVRAAVQATPLTIDEWVGVDQRWATSTPATVLPNVVVHRVYEHVRSGARVGLLIVHCRDARDLHALHPRTYYADQGYALLSERPQLWDVDGRQLRGGEYELVYEAPSRSSQIVVCSFVVGPGSTAQAIGVDAAANRPERVYGAARYTLVFDPSTAEQERRDIFHTIVASSLAAIDAVSSGD